MAFLRLAMYTTKRSLTRKCRFGGALAIIVERVLPLTVAPSPPPQQLHPVPDARPETKCPMTKSSKQKSADRGASPAYAGITCRGSRCSSQARIRRVFLPLQQTAPSSRPGVILASVGTVSLSQRARRAGVLARTLEGCELPIDSGRFIIRRVGEQRHTLLLLRGEKGVGGACAGGWGSEK